jgi:hypothetical protein
LNGKTKIIRVTSCISCPLVSVTGDKLVCNTVMGGRRVAGAVCELMLTDAIPEWCPLLDEEALLSRL